jgi:hypothetical protein
MAAAIQEHEAPDPAGTLAPATFSTLETEQEPAQSLQPPGEPDAASHGAESDFESVWADVRNRIELAQQALPDPPSFGSFDDVQRAIDQLRTTLAQTPIALHDTADASGEVAEASSSDGTALARDGVQRLDERLASVDAVYGKARSADHQFADDEWAGVRAIHAGVHNLWDTIKAAAGTYWAQFAADARIRGLLSTLATRAARAIAAMTSAAAKRLEQRTSPRPLNTGPAEPTLREAYVDARAHIRAHAASHEWQRITALWNTVNTLARQTDDPGIRAVVARSADAISDHADTLRRKATRQSSQRDATDALAILARTAERHAATLRGETLEPRQVLSGRTESQTAANGVPLINDLARSHQGADPQALQASARQVAQRVQARLGQPPLRMGSALRRPVNASSPNGQHLPARSAQPATRREPSQLHAR